MNRAIERTAPPLPAWGVALSERELVETSGGGWALLLAGLVLISAAVGIVDVIVFGGCECRDSGDAA